MPTLVSTGSLTLVDLNDSVQLVLSLPAVALPASSAGVVSSFATAVSTARVMQGGADVTSLWALSKADSNCTSTLAGGVVTVSALSADAGSVTVTATRAGWATLTAVFALSKAKAGANAATVYLFQRTASATAPSLPTDSVTYTFATGAATGLTNGWTQALPATGGAYRWITTATALGTGSTDTIATGEWAAAALMAQDGAGSSLLDSGPWGPEVNGWEPQSGGTVTTPWGADPKGADTVLWRCAATVSAAAPSYQGGWISPSIPVDPSRTWRVVMPMRRVGAAVQAAGVVNCVLVNGNSALCTINTATVNNGAVTSSPGLTAAGMPQDEWMLVVGYIYPAGSTGRGAADAGVYRCSTGVKLSSGTNWCWASGATAVQVRAGLWLGSGSWTAAVTVEFGRPWVHIVDGTEPPLSSFAPPSEILNAQQRWSDVQAVPFTSIGGDADSTSLGFNGAFLNWPVGTTYPVGWSVWSAGTITRDTSVVRDADGTPSMKMVCTGSNVGVNRMVNLVAPLPAGAFLWGSVDLLISARTSGLPVVLVRLYTNSALTTYVDTQVIPATTVGSWQRLSWTARTTNLADRIYGIQVYLMGSWTSGSGGAFTGTCYFENLFFEMVDKSIDNRSLQFSEVAGALTFTPSGNGSSTFTAVTQNNKVTSGNVGSYIQQGALTAANSSKVTVSSQLMASSGTNHAYSTGTVLSFTPSAIGAVIIFMATAELFIGSVGAGPASVSAAVTMSRNGQMLHSLEGLLHVVQQGIGVRSCEHRGPLLFMWVADSTSAQVIDFGISTSYFDSSGNPVSSQPYHSYEIRLVALENKA